MQDPSVNQRRQHLANYLLYVILMLTLLGCAIHELAAGSLQGWALIVKLLCCAMGVIALAILASCHYHDAQEPKELS